MWKDTLPESGLLRTTGAERRWAVDLKPNISYGPQPVSSPAIPARSEKTMNAIDRVARAICERTSDPCFEACRRCQSRAQRAIDAYLDEGKLVSVEQVRKGLGK